MRRVRPRNSDRGAGIRKTARSKDGSDEAVCAQNQAAQQRVLPADKRPQRIRLESRTNGFRALPNGALRAFLSIASRD
jgi:hypothetical protein